MKDCIHPKLQLQQIAPEECLERGDIGWWYKCERCGAEFRTTLIPYQIQVRMGVNPQKEDADERNA